MPERQASSTPWCRRATSSTCCRRTARSPCSSSTTAAGSTTSRCPTSARSPASTPTRHGRGLPSSSSRSRAAGAASVSTQAGGLGARAHERRAVFDRVLGVAPGLHLPGRDGDRPVPRAPGRGAVPAHAGHPHRLRRLRHRLHARWSPRSRHGASRAASTPSPASAVAMRRGRPGTKPACGTRSRTCSTTSRRGRPPRRRRPDGACGWRSPAVRTVGCWWRPRSPSVPTSLGRCTAASP